MITVFTILAVVAAYLIGAIPTSVWIGKFFYGIDVREHGSGNAGTTNTFRVLGVKAGIPVFIIDISKGFFAVKIITLFETFIPGTAAYVNFQIILGVVAVIGHIFPVYVGFKGGKGVATLLGLVIALHPPSALIAAGIWAISLLLSRYVSLSSMIAGLSFPILIIGVYHETTHSLIFFSMIISVLLLLTHQQNIERLLNKEESKAKLFKRKKAE